MLSEDIKVRYIQKIPFRSCRNNDPFAYLTELLNIREQSYSRCMKKSSSAACSQASLYLVREGGGLSRGSR